MNFGSLLRILYFNSVPILNPISPRAKFSLITNHSSISVVRSILVSKVFASTKPVIRKVTTWGTPFFCNKNDARYPTTRIIPNNTNGCSNRSSATQCLFEGLLKSLLNTYNQIERVEPVSTCFHSSCENDQFLRIFLLKPHILSF